MLFSVSPHTHIFPREINSFQPVSPIHSENVIFSMVMARDEGGRHSNEQEAENALADKWNVKMKMAAREKAGKWHFINDIAHREMSVIYNRSREGNSRLVESSVFISLHQIKCNLVCKQQV